jgi:hypothetical protein
VCVSWTCSPSLRRSVGMENPQAERNNGVRRTEHKTNEPDTVAGRVVATTPSATLFCTLLIVTATS